MDRVLVPFHCGELVSFRPPGWAGRGRPGSVQVHLAEVEGLKCSNASRPRVGCAGLGVPVLACRRAGLAGRRILQFLVGLMAHPVWSGPLDEEWRPAECRHGQAELGGA